MKFLEFVGCSSRFISFNVDGRLPDNKFMIPSKIKRLMQNITSKILKMLIPHDNPNIPPRIELYYEIITNIFHEMYFQTFMISHLAKKVCHEAYA